jgi:nucleoside-diphosphate-sugar epimerase
MNCLVIGFGWLGKPLALELKNKGHKVFASSRDLEKINIMQDEGVLAWHYDANTINVFPEWFGELDIIVFNLPPSGIADYPRALKKIAANAPKKCRIIFTSSTGVYLNNEGTINEESNLNLEHPVTQAEKALQNSSKNFIILRLAGLIGGERHPVKHLSGRTLENGSQVVNLVHRNDVIRAITHLIKSEKMNTVFNVCYPDHPSRTAYYTKTAISRDLAPPKFTESSGTGKIVSSEKLEKELNFTFKNAI